MMPEKCCFSWQNINVSVLEQTKSFWKTTTKVKLVLDNVSGFATSNSLFAIMGSSGSGKTSLLRAISGHCRLKTGILQVNNNLVTDDEVKSMSGYVPQQDIFTEYLTVLEHLQFMAALRLKNKSKLKHTNIKQLLSEFCLDNQGSTWIKNLSGGEKRRLSLAGELISDPFILFCDEPTTGLDSYNSLLVIEKLQREALSGKIVLATIHQPSSQLFEYFDNISLLAEGKLVFQGTRDEASSFFASLNLFCPLNYNPLDFYIKCITTGNISEMCKLFESRKTETAESDHTDIFLEKKGKISFCQELKWLLWRNFLSINRNKGTYLGAYFLVLFDLFVVSLLYSEISLSDSHSPQDIEGFFGFLASEFTFTNMYSVVNVFPSEVEVFVREKALYSSHAYFISKVLSIVPLVIITTILYMSILFATLKFLNGIYLWFQITYWMFLVSMAGSGLGLAFSATFSTVEHIDLYLGPVEFFLLLLSGLMVRLDKLPVIFIWMKYLSPFYYAFDSSSNLFWGNVSFVGNCTGERTVPCVHNGTEVLQNYGIYKTYPAIFNILGLHCVTILFMIIGFVGIVRKKILYSI